MELPPGTIYFSFYSTGWCFNVVFEMTVQFGRAQRFRSFRPLINLGKRLHRHERLHLCAEVLGCCPKQLPETLSGARWCINGASSTLWVSREITVQCLLTVSWRIPLHLAMGRTLGKGYGSNGAISGSSGDWTGLIQICLEHWASLQPQPSSP